MDQEQYDPSAHGTLRDKMIKTAANKMFKKKYGSGSDWPVICQEMYLVLAKLKDGGWKDVKN